MTMGSKNLAVIAFLFQETNMDGTRFLRRYKGLLLVMMFLLVVVSIAQTTGWRETVSLGYLRQTLSEHQWSGLLTFMLLFSLGNLVQIPGWIFLVAAVLVLGRGIGGVVTYVSAVTSCAVTFLAVGFMGGDALRQIDSKVATRLLDHLHAHPVRNIVILRTLFQTLPALNYSLALSGTGFRNYMAGTLLGLPLPIAMYCLLFEYLAVFVSAAGHAGGAR